MHVVYYSMTGNVRRFVNKTEFPTTEVRPGLMMDVPFILVTNTIGWGQPPDIVKDFLEDNNDYLIAVASSGNLVWGKNFARSAEVISERYNVPILLKFEMAGEENDIKLFKERVHLIEKMDRESRREV